MTANLAELETKTMVAPHNENKANIMKLLTQSRGGGSKLPSPIGYSKNFQVMKMKTGC